MRGWISKSKILLPVIPALVLAAGVTAVSAIAGAPPDAEISKTGSGYTVDVPIEVNGSKQSFDVGDVVFTGASVEFDKGPVWDAVAQIAPELETAALVSLVNEVWNLPDGYCEFGEEGLSLGASAAIPQGTSRTETLSFSVGDDCEVTFDGGEEEQTEPAPADDSSSGDLFGSLLPLKVAHASSSSEPDEEDITGLNRVCSEAETVGRGYGGDRGLHFADDVPLSTDSNTRHLGVEVTARVRDDAQDTVLSQYDEEKGIEKKLKLDEDCILFFTNIDAQFNYDGNTPDIKKQDGTCGRWQVSLDDTEFFSYYPRNIILYYAASSLLSSIGPFWNLDNCEYQTPAVDSDNVATGTLGVYSINDGLKDAEGNESPLLKLLKDAGYIESGPGVTESGTYTLLNTEGVRLQSQAFFVPNPSQSGSESPNAGYYCHINKLPFIKVNLNDTEVLKIEQKILGLDLTSLSRIKAVRIPDGGFRTTMECSVRYYTDDEDTTGPVAPPPPATTQPPEETTPTTQPPAMTPTTQPPAQIPPRSLEDESEYVDAYYPNATFSKSITMREYSFRHTSTEEYTVNVPAYNYESRRFDVYNYEQRRFDVYNYEPRRFDVYNYEQRRYNVYNYEQRRFDVYNYEQRSVPVYNYERRRVNVYNYEQRRYNVYNYEQERYCVKRGGFLWSKCVEWGTRTVRVAPFTEVRRVRVAPYTEWRNVRVAPYTEVRNVRVAPFTELRRVRVAPFTELRRVRVAPYLEVRQVRIAPFTELRYARVAPFTEVRDVRVAPFMEEEARTREVVSYTYETTSSEETADTYVAQGATLVRSYTLTVATDYEGNITDCDSTCAKHRSDLQDAPIVAEANNKTVTASEWRSALSQLGLSRNYDRGMLNDRNKVTTLEAAQRALEKKYTIAPLHKAGGTSVTPSELRDAVSAANDKETMHTHSERLSAVMNGIN